MDFLVEIPHEEQNCLELIRLLHAQGDLTKLKWGCHNGVHTGWGVITASNEAEARLVVPPIARRKARVVKVARFDAGITTQLHKTEPALPNLARLQMYRAFPCWW